MPSFKMMPLRTGEGYTCSSLCRSQLANGSLYINTAAVYGSIPELTGSYQCLASVDDVGAIVSRTATIKLAS